jgi:hypothetical protein
MVRAAQMEIGILDEKYRTVFYQALQGFSQLLLIDKGIGIQAPTEAAIRELALSTLERNAAFFTVERFPGLNTKSLFSDYKKATEDSQPVWTTGLARPSFLEDHATKIDTIAGLLHDVITRRWLDKVHELQQKEKAALLQSTQRAFFKTAATRETAEGLAKERSLDETHIDTVIDDKIATKAKHVRASLSKLENMIRRAKISDDSKNSKGGAKKTERASQKSKTNTKPPPRKPPTKKPPRNPRNADAAGGAGSATSKKGNGKNVKQKPRKKPGVKGKKGTHPNA